MTLFSLHYWMSVWPFSGFLIVRTGWMSPASLWTVRSGNLAAAESSQTSSSYKIWTELSGSASESRKKCNCQLVVLGPSLIVEVLSDIPEGDLIVLNKDYSTDLLRGFLPLDYPIDLSSPLFFSLQNQKISPDTILR